MFCSFRSQNRPQPKSSNALFLSPHCHCNSLRDCPVLSRKWQRSCHHPQVHCHARQVLLFLLHEAAQPWQQIFLNTCDVSAFDSLCWSFYYVSSTNQLSVLRIATDRLYARECDGWILLHVTCAWRPTITSVQYLFSTYGEQGSFLKLDCIYLRALYFS